MAKYAIFLSIPKRTQDRYSREEIENAAKIVWHASPPVECEALSEPEAMWVEDMFTFSGIKGVRVMGEFTEPEEKEELADAKDEG